MAANALARFAPEEVLPGPAIESDTDLRRAAGDLGKRRVLQREIGGNLARDEHRLPSGRGVGRRVGGGDVPGRARGGDALPLGERLKLMDFDAAAKLSGARFVVLKGALARQGIAIERADPSRYQALIETELRRPVPPTPAVPPGASE